MYNAGVAIMNYPRLHSPDMTGLFDGLSTVRSTRLGIEPGRDTSENPMREPPFRRVMSDI